jgi:WD40 repeat protein
VGICNVCYQELTGDRGTRYSALQFQDITSRGFYPPESFFTQMASVVGRGATSAQAFGMWLKVTVPESKTDWLLCPTCAERARTYAPTTGERCIGLHGRGINCVAISPDGRRAMAGSTKHAFYGGTDAITMWDIDSQSQLGMIAVGCRAVAFSNDGRQVLSTNTEHAILLSGSDNYGKRKNGTGFLCDNVATLVFSPDGTRALTGQDNGTLTLWELPSGRKLRKFGGWFSESHPNVVTVGLSSDGRAISGGGKVVKIWNLNTKQSYSFNMHNQDVVKVGFSPDRQCGFSIDSSGTALFWHLDSGTIIRKIKVSDADHIAAPAVSADACRVAGLFGDSLCVHDVESGSEIARFRTRFGSHNVATLAISANGKRVLGGTTDGFLRTYEAR